MEDYRINLTAGDITWTGTTSTDWADATNWTPELVPTAAFDVVIPDLGVGANYPIINAVTNAKCHNLVLEDNATLDVDGKLELVTPPNYRMDLGI